LRAPLTIAVIGAGALIVGGAVHGWATVLYVAPIVVALVIGYYVWAGRDSDMAALIRREPDERQVDLRLKVQALIGRVLSPAVAVAYIVAISTHMTLWPFAILLSVPFVVGAIGWSVYREHQNNTSKSARS
jgi:hypothetical protein